ncbi:MAG: VWA domain-containing protein [Bacteroidales bacterium]|nr:VWA domain-containing protein [Bacteroidales bacterium]
MLHFEHTSYLWLLVPVALAGVAWALLNAMQRRRLASWADKGMFTRLIPDRSGWRPAAKMALTLLGLALLVVALANPLLGTRMEKGKRAGSDVAICIDLSNSMMAEDIQPNRLERAKRVVSNLLASMAGDRVSLVAFAGSSFIQMPLTADYGAAKLFLDDMDCSMISEQGTAIGDAIDKAMRTLGYGDEDGAWQRNSNRAIVVISDGENHEDDAVGAAKEAAREGVRVCTVGMGLPEGSPIPEKGGYKRDRQGNVVMTHLNEQMLMQVAQAGRGVYVRVGTGTSNLKEVTDLIAGLDKEEYSEAQFAAYESRYMYPLAAGLVCLLLEVLIFERRNRKFNIDRII